VPVCPLFICENSPETGIKRHISEGLNTHVEKLIFRGGGHLIFGVK
jgi:hypothetical protein